MTKGCKCYLLMRIDVRQFILANGFHSSLPLIHRLLNVTFPQPHYQKKGNAFAPTTA